MQSSRTGYCWLGVHNKASKKVKIMGSSCIKERWKLPDYLSWSLRFSESLHPSLGDSVALVLYPHPNNTAWLPSTISSLWVFWRQSLRQVRARGRITRDKQEYLMHAAGMAAAVQTYVSEIQFLYLKNAR